MTTEKYLLRRICRPNATASCTEFARSKLDFLQSVNGDVEVQIDGDAVRDQDAVVDVLQAFLLEHRKLGKKGGYVKHHSRADEIYASRVDQSTWKEMEAVPRQHPY